MPTGANNCHALGLPMRPLFAADSVAYFGHQIGIVVADTRRDARRAASLVKANIEQTQVRIDSTIHSFS